jgi:alkanesulfonate monooxygenase SsuD/methylene tetrahydromethanopterin reductase-like flavin-dependent oxidoreductase (luciferase family)
LWGLGVKAQEAGFDGLWISDHYHPWNDEQGHSPFVWSTIGALAQATDAMTMTTAVTCPTVRIPPAIIAQAAATSAVMLEGRFRLGVGSGEALNEHILGDRWPEADKRLEMLEEAVHVIRALWQGGVRDHRGRHSAAVTIASGTPASTTCPHATADRRLGIRPQGGGARRPDRRRLLHRQARCRVGAHVSLPVAQREPGAGWVEGVLERGRGVRSQGFDCCT